MSIVEKNIYRGIFIALILSPWVIFWFTRPWVGYTMMIAMSSMVDLIEVWIWGTLEAFVW